MNTSRIFTCPKCKERFSVVLVMLSEWDGQCPHCGFWGYADTGWSHDFDFNPNDPQDQKAHPEMVPKGIIFKE